MLSDMTRGTGGRRIALGKQIELLRQGQRLSMEAAAVKARISATTWRRVERGQGVHGLTYRAVEEALGLPLGVIDDYLAKKVALEAVERRPAPGETPIDTGDLTETQKGQVRAFIQAITSGQDRSA